MARWDRVPAQSNRQQGHAEPEDVRVEGVASTGIQDALRTQVLGGARVGESDILPHWEPRRNTKVPQHDVTRLV